jgi:hypothetical protein
LALLLVSGACAFGCGKKADRGGPPPETTGLAAVPFNAEVIVGADVSKLAASPIIERAVDQLLLRDEKLAATWQQVREGCKIDIAKQVKHVLLAVGPTPPGGRPGTGPTLMIATGNIPEADLSECVGKFVGKGGGSITGKTAGGRTVYQVKDGARVMFFAFGRADTVVLGTTESYVIEAIGPGKKALDHPELAAWLKLVDQNLPLWAVGRIDERVRRARRRIAWPQGRHHRGRGIDRSHDRRQARARRSWRRRRTPSSSNHSQTTRRRCSGWPRS